MLEEIKASYVRTANGIPNWRNLDKNTLLNLYIDNEEDDILSNAYFACIVCKYWPAIGKYYTKSKKSVDIEECYDWLIHALTYALKNRKWRDPSSAMYHDKNGPDKVVNRCIASTRNIFYQASNTAKRRVNYQSDSIERQIEAFGDAADALSLCDNDAVDKNDAATAIVSEFIGRGDYISAIIVDQIAFQDSFKENKEKEERTFLNEFGEKEKEEYYRYSYLFDERKLVKNLNHIDERYVRYFCSMYLVEYEDVLPYAKKILNSSNNVIYRLVRKALYDIKNDKSFSRLLCL